MTNIIPDRLVEWTVGFGAYPPFGHVSRWRLEPVGDHETDVTNYCDWTNISDEMRSGVSWPVVPVEKLERSVKNLARLALTEWTTVPADEVRAGQRVPIQGGELFVSRIERPILGRPTMLAFIEDTPHRRRKRPVPVDGEVEVLVSD